LGTNSSQIKDAHGEVVGGMMIFTDLTPVRHLREIRKKAQKREFLGKVAQRLSHELRNSFVPIKSMVELLPAKYSDEEFREKLFGVAEREIGRIDALIDRLVFFSQTLHLDKVACGVGALVAASIERSKEMFADNKEVHYSANCPDDSLLVYVDQDALVEVFTHILNNSVEAVQGDAVEINIKCALASSLPDLDAGAKSASGMAVAASGGYAMIEIRDNGPGFSAEASAEVFDPFFSTKNRGVGLGLTIVQTVVEEHGGAVVLDNTKGGVGAIVAVYLPRYCPPS